MSKAKKKPSRTELTCAKALAKAGEAQVLIDFATGLLTYAHVDLEDAYRVLCRHRRTAGVTVVARVMATATATAVARDGAFRAMEISEAQFSTDRMEDDHRRTVRARAAEAAKAYVDMVVESYGSEREEG